MTTATTKARSVNYDARTSTMTITQGENATNYRVEAYASEIGGRAFQLTKEDEFGEPCECYDVLVGGEADSCDCKDATYRSKQCKHHAALSALIKAGRI
jgi:hypothetical protein